MRPPDQPGGGVAAGSIATVFGDELASDTLEAASSPLPRQMLGTSVMIDGMAAPLLLVSPGRINFQAPLALTPAAPAVERSASLIVRTPTGESDPVAVRIRARNPGIFTMDGSGCGPGLVFNVAPDGSASLNSADSPARPGDLIRILATGVDVAGIPVPDGVASQDELIWRNHWLLIGSDYQAVESSRKAAGLVGVDQVDGRVPENTPESCTVPLRIVSVIGSSLTAPSPASQPVPLSINRSDRPCEDKPRTYARLEWVHRETSGITPAPPSDSLEVSLSSAVWMRPEPPPPEGYTYCRCSDTWKTPFGPSCGGFESYERLSSLDAGPLTLRFAGIPSETFQPEPGPSGPLYRIPLPARTVQPGEYEISSSGGGDVGGFTTGISIPEPIRLTTEFPPGTAKIPSGWYVAWTGGEPNMIVRGRLTTRTSQRDRVCDCFTGAQRRVLYFQYPFPRGSSGPLESDDADLEITVMPAKDTLFEASGLTLGGKHTWSYRYHFGGLRVTWLPGLPAGSTHP